MSTRTMQNSATAAVIDECSSWIERGLILAARAIAAARARQDRKAQRRHLGRLSQARLRDIGLDDPQRQRQLLGAYLDAEGDGLDERRGRILDARWSR